MKNTCPRLRCNFLRSFLHHKSLNARRTLPWALLRPLNSEILSPEARVLKQPLSISPTASAAKMSTKSSESKSTPAQAAKKPKVPFIVQFFDPEVRAKDPSGRDLDDILTYSDNQISRKHDFIQYIFPLPEQSMVTPWAPLIIKEAYEAFRDREELRSELLQGFLRMLEFYGFTLSTSESEGAEKQIVKGQNFNEQSKYSWRRSMDHNHLRLTRIIRCLRVLSCEKEAQMLYHALLEYDTSDVVRSSTKMFWWRAAERPLWLPPDEPHDDADGIRWLKEVCEAQEESKAVEGVRMAEEAQKIQNGGGPASSDAVGQKPVTKEVSKDEAKAGAASDDLMIDDSEVGKPENDDPEKDPDKRT